jgi:glycosyltransferase involved in cell wall biosynthesis
MACGTPVITSTTSSLPEIAGDAARLVEPSSEAQLTEAMRTLVADAAAREALATRGLAQAQRFTWERTAQATVEVYRRCLAEGGGR